jgi:hypothetical protein
MAGQKATETLKSSGNLRAVQSLLGHKSIKTTEIYSHLTDKYLQAVVNVLPSPNLGTPVVLPGCRIVQVLNEIRNATKTPFLYINSPYLP